MRAPHLKYAKAIALAAAAAGLVGTGALVEHWRMGKKVAESKLARATALSDRQQAAMAEALRVTHQLHGELQAERKRNAGKVAASAAAVPTAPEFACRDKPLPEPYLETFRQ